VIGLSVDVGQPQMIFGDGKVYFETMDGNLPEY
jgi:hypothetical protein